MHLPPDTLREPVRTRSDLATLDQSEVLEGYLDGLKGEMPCGENRPRSYWHGYRNGESDRTGVLDEHQRALAADVVRG